jgi:hypothetical protein
MVVQDQRQPRSCGRPIAVQDEDVELGVVGLPDLVWPVRFAAVDQLVAVTPRGRAVLGERHQRRVDRGDDPRDRAVRRHRPPLLTRDLSDAPSDRRCRQSRSPQRERLDQTDELRLCSAAPVI